jgi:hypothetical protein
MVMFLVVEPNHPGLNPSFDMILKVPKQTMISA